MVRIRKTRNLRQRTPLWIYFAAGVSAVALVTLVVLFAARTVQAYADLSRPTTTTPAAASSASATPAALSHNETQDSKSVATVDARRWNDKVHGMASWYGSVFNGRKTASGEIFDMYAMTACHATLPFGSIVRVVNLSNHRSVVVRITDRGDLIDEGRVIDLSYAAAEKLGMTLAGLVKVDLQVLSVGRPGDRE